MNLDRKTIAKQNRAARRERLTQGLALAALLLMGGIVIDDEDRFIRDRRAERGFRVERCLQGAGRT